MNTWTPTELLVEEAGAALFGTLGFVVESRVEIREASYGAGLLAKGPMPHAPDGAVRQLASGLPDDTVDQVVARSRVRGTRR